MASYAAGQLVRLSVSFTVAGVATDPTTVACKVKTPDGLETSYTLAGGQVVKDSVGAYHFDFAVAQAGWHYYGFTGTGTVQAASEGTFAGVTNL